MRLRAMVAVVVLTGALATACSSGGQPAGGGGSGGSGGIDLGSLPTGLSPHPLPRKTTITVVTGVPNEGYAYLYVAQALGEFAKENLDVNIHTVSDASTVVPLLTQGKVDFAVSGLFGGLFNVLQSGAYLRFITDYGDPAHGPTAAGWWQLTKGQSKPSACELKGKSVGTPAPTSAIVLDLANYLATCNLKTSDVRFVTVASADALTALKSGAVQAAYSLEPFTSLIAQSGIAQLVAPQRDGLAGVLVGGMAKHQPDVVQAFVRALVRTAQTYLQGDYRANPQVLDAITKYVGVPANVLEESKPRVFDPNLTLSAIEANLVPIQQYWIGTGGVLTYDTPIPASDIVDPTFLDNATKGG